MSFLPSDLSLLEVWLEGDSGVTLSGSNVTDWADQSGNSHNGTTSSSTRPAYVSSALNGKPGISFTGAKLFNDSASALGDMTVFVVGKLDSGASSTYQALASWGSSYQPDLYLQSAGGGNFFHAVQWGSSVANSTGITTVRNVGFLYQTTIDATAKTIRARLNAAEAGGNPYSAAGVGTTPTGFTIGTDGPDGYQGLITALVVYRRKLTTAETQQVESYLAQKYGLVLGYVSGDAVSTTTATGGLTGAGALAGGATSTTTGAGDLIASAALAGASTSTTTASADITALAALAGDTTSTTTALGDLAGLGSLDGAATSTTTSAGDLAGLALLGGGASSDTTGAGDLTGTGALEGDATSTTDASGDPLYLAGLAGGATSTTDAAGDLTAAGGSALDGVAVSTTTATGDLGGTAALAGAATSTTSSAGDLTAAGGLTGAAVSATTATGDIGGTGALAGGATSTTVTTGDLSGTAGLAGDATSTTGASGAVAGLALLGGGASSDTTAAGDMTGAGALSGGATSPTTATGGLTGAVALEGEATSTTDATGDLTDAGAMTIVALEGEALSTTDATGDLGGTCALEGGATSGTDAAGDPLYLARLRGRASSDTSAESDIDSTTAAVLLPEVFPRTDADLGGYFRYATDLAVPWLSGHYGLTYLQSHGIGRDAMTAAYEDAIRVRYVDVGPDGALAHQGEDRKLPRYPGEAASRYRERLRGAWRSYRRAGKKDGVVSALRDAGVEAIVYEAWEVDAGPQFSAWYWYHVLVPSPGLSFSGGVWNDPGTWDETAGWDDTGQPMIDLILRVLSQWAPAHEKLATITLLVEGGTWDFPPGLWQDEAGSWENSISIQWVNNAANAV